MVLVIIKFLLKTWFVKECFGFLNNELFLSLVIVKLKINL